MKLLLIRYLNSMRSNFFILLLIFTTLSIASQVTVEGTVYEKNSPLEGAAVYLNNTMLGTTTDKKGTFSLPVKNGAYELVISYLGYQKIVYNFNTSTYTKPLFFTLKEKENQLDEIIIKNTVFNERWNKNLSIFKRHFLGTTKFREGCKILNEKTLFFTFDSITRQLKAFAKEPLKIKHSTLGYSIIFELEYFVSADRYVSFLGFSRYKELEGSKRKKKKWKKNRLEAYNGSTVHFYKSLINKSLEQEGFVVNQFKRLKNLERPEESEIEKARKIINLNRSIAPNLNFKSPSQYTKLDSAWVTLRKASLPSFNDYLYKSNLREDDIIGLEGENYKFIFKNNLSVIYLREPEELGFIKRNMIRRKKLNSQTSSIIQLSKNIKLDKNGVLINPLDVIYEGYWSYEKFANQVPLDYVPNNIEN